MANFFCRFCENRPKKKERREGKRYQSSAEQKNFHKSIYHSIIKKKMGNESRGRGRGRKAVLFASCTLVIVVKPLLLFLFFLFCTCAGGEDAQYWRRKKEMRKKWSILQYAVNRRLFYQVEGVSLDFESRNLVKNEQNLRW
jgi:hypothetical protein